MYMFHTYAIPWHYTHATYQEGNVAWYALFTGACELPSSFELLRKL